MARGLFYELGLTSAQVGAIRDAAVANLTSGVFRTSTSVEGVSYSQQPTMSTEKVLELCRQFFESTNGSTRRVVSSFRRSHYGCD